MPTPNDITGLLARVALGDRQAFDLLYQKTSAKLFGVSLRLLKDRTEAEDVLQEVYIKVWQRADRFNQSDASPMSWLIAITRNHAIDRIRARKTVTADIEEIAELADKAPTPEANVIAGSDRRKINECLEQLEKVKSSAVRGAYMEGYSYQELSDRYKIPLNTVRTWLRRSLAKLKECLSE